MSEQKHTMNHLTARGRDLFDQDGIVALAACRNHPTEQEAIANAVRLAACWNACEQANLSTEALSSGIIAELIEAVMFVAAMEDCEEAADWKDAHGRLTRTCASVLRKVKMGNRHAR